MAAAWEGYCRVDPLLLILGDDWARAALVPVGPIPRCNVAAPMAVSARAMNCCARHLAP